uniref:Uncharacterized protein n=1 Tax=Anguilla anguilla TaxID=7936 RepID=A0A0E9Q0F5_ANGAN
MGVCLYSCDRSSIIFGLIQGLNHYHPCSKWFPVFRLCMGCQANISQSVSTV